MHQPGVSFLYQNLQEKRLRKYVKSKLFFRKTNFYFKLAVLRNSTPANVSSELRFYPLFLKKKTRHIFRFYLWRLSGLKKTRQKSRGWLFFPQEYLKIIFRMIYGYNKHYFPSRPYRSFLCLPLIRARTTNTTFGTL